MNRAFRLGLAALMTLLAGCGTLKTSAPGGEAADLLAFYRYAGTLDADALVHERRNFRNWVRAAHCSPDRLRLAMLIMHSADASDTKVREVLAPCLAEGDRKPRHLRNLAFLLADQMQRRRDLDARIAELKARRKELEQEIEQSARRRKRLEAEREDLKKRVDSLQKQLEALKDIERSIRQR